MPHLQDETDQLSGYSMRLAANQISILSSTGSNTAQSMSLNGWDVWVKGSSEKEGANSSDYVDTEVMEAGVCCHLCLLSKVLPCPRTFPCDPAFVLCQRASWNHILPLSFSVLIISWADEPGSTCKAIPNGSFGCCLVALSWCDYCNQV